MILFGSELKYDISYTICDIMANIPAHLARSVHAYVVSSLHEIVTKEYNIDVAIYFYTMDSWWRKYCFTPWISRL